MTNEQLTEIFTYHPPTDAQRAIYEQINAAFLACANEVNRLCPEGPGQTVAIRKLQEARHQANACVALNGKF